MEMITCGFNYNQNIPPGCIVCAWCAKVGMKLFTLRTTNGCKAFCSELCFTQCRRASFKKNKICDWCKHVRHTVNYVDFQDGEQQLQFCSNKCLNQYKMNIFCNETKAHLHLNPNLIKETSKLSSISKTSNLITPELWLKDSKNGENDYNSVNSLKDSSESELDLELEDSPQPMAGHQNKRKFSEFSKDVNELKANDIQKDIPNKDKSNKESKRLKHSNKLGNSSSRQTSGAKHSKHSTPELVPQNDWTSRDSNDKTSSFHSPSYRPHARHSPIPPPLPPVRSSIVPPNNNIPLLNGHSAVNQGIRPNPPLNSMPANSSPNGQIFPRLPGSLGRGTPLIPSQHFAPRMPAMPNLFGAAQMEMLARMHSSFAGLRPPLPPFGPPPPLSGYSFPGLPHVSGVHPSNGSPLMQPPIQSSGSLPSQLYPNLSLMPPITVMAPYPVPIPIPIPIPVPFLFPVDKESISKNKVENNWNNNNNHKISSSNEVTTSSSNSTSNTSATTASKVESVISKLVERKARANTNQNNSEGSVDLRRVTSEDNVINESNSDNSSESLPQNLIVNRDKRSVDMSVSSGYGVP